MAKVKLEKFELLASINDSKRLMDYLQQFGCAHIEDTNEEFFSKYDNTQLILGFRQQQKQARQAVEVLQKACEVKTSILAPLTDYSSISYDEYRQFSGTIDETSDACMLVNKTAEEIEELKAEIIRMEGKINQLQPWMELDIPMSSKMTRRTRLFIGQFKQQFTREEIFAALAEKDNELDGVAVEIISSQQLQTCALIICGASDAERTEQALSKIGFTLPEDPANSIPAAAVKAIQGEIEQKQKLIERLTEQLQQMADWIERFKYLADYYEIQADKYRAIEAVGATNRIVYLTGYVPEKRSEELKFELENRFTAQLELSEPDYENDDVPVLLQNDFFASGVESITDMYAVPSNDDVDPNPIMSFFYYSLFGLMLSDAGYGVLMILFGALMKWKFKVTGTKAKTASFAFWCGVSTTIWGALFGSWFGDLIPTICTTFLHMEKAPNLTIWFSPQEDSMRLLLYSFLFGIIHLYAGLAIHGFNLLRHKDYIGAFCETIPIYVFVTGFAIVAKDFLEPVSEQTKSLGGKLLIVGAVLIVLTAGHNAKNIAGKLGGGLYGLYNTATGYMSDILSYSRLLALNLVTGVIAMVVNLLAAMPGNIFIFIVIFLAGHGVNLAINLIGTYVHTNRLQYVEFFSKFYEGGGRSFTPFKFNTNYLRFKEDNNNV